MLHYIVICMEKMGFISCLWQRSIRPLVCSRWLGNLEFSADIRLKEIGFFELHGYTIWKQSETKSMHIKTRFARKFWTVFLYSLNMLCRSDGQNNLRTCLVYIPWLSSVYPGELCCHLCRYILTPVLRTLNCSTLSRNQLLFRCR